MADSKPAKAAGKGAAKTPPSPQDAPQNATSATAVTSSPVHAQESTDPAMRAMARAAQPTPAIAGVTAPAGPSSLTTVAPQQVRKPEPFLSEGMRNDLQDLGYAIDPVSGARFDRDPDSGEVTMRERVTPGVPAAVADDWGKATTIDVAFAPQPAANDTDRAQDVTSNPLVSDQDVAPPEQPGEPTERPSVLATGETLSYDTATGVTTAHNPATGETRVVGEDELRAAQELQDDED